MAFNIDQYNITVSIDDQESTEKSEGEIKPIYPKLTESENVECTVPSATLKEACKEEYFYDWILKNLMKNQNGLMIALIEEIGESRCVTYEELIDSARRIATYMVHHGVKNGDRIMICMENSVEFVFYQLGIFLLGAVPVIVNPSHIGFSDGDECTTAVVDYENYETITKISKGAFENLERVFILSYDITIIKLPRHLWIIDGFGFMSFSPNFEVGVPEKPANAFIFSPSQKNHDSIAHTQKSAFKVCNKFYKKLFTQLPDMEQKTHLITNGLYNYNSLCYLLYVLCKGETCILTESHQEVWRASFIDQISGIIEQYKIPVLFSNSQFLKCFVKYEIQNIFELKCLKAIVNFGPSVSFAIAEQFMAILNTVKLYQAYSATEFGVVSFGLVEKSSESVKMSSLSNCGLPLKGMQIKIAHMETETEVECGEWGQILLRGPQLFCYYSGEQKTKPGKNWFKTGDYGMIDKQKKLHVHGPISSLLNTNDTTVPSELIECTLSSHRLIDDAVVMQSNRQIWCGILVKSEMECPSSGQLESFLKANKIYVTISKTTVLDFIPRSEDGAISRSEVPYLMNTIGRCDALEDFQESSI